MKHRERVLAALEHEEPDRCPMQISFTPEFASRLEEDMKISRMKEHNPHGGGNTYDLERALDQDLLLTSVGWANSYYQQNGRYTDEWGINWLPVEYQTRFGRGYYTEIETHPLDHDSAIGSYRAPDPSRPELYMEAERVIRDFKDEYWIVGVTVTTVFETAWALRGLDRLFMDFVLNPDLAEHILDIPFNYHLAAAKELVRLGVDMIWTGDDIGCQSGLIISPDMWRRFFKGRMYRFFTELRQINRDVKIAYHSDGNIETLIPDLIEIGIDVLNPVQPACMDPAEIKKKYGKHLCFWGTIDEQHTLPFGSPETVKNEVLTRLRTAGRNGGLILGPTHHVQIDTPIENFWAMANTIRQTKYSDI